MTNTITRGANPKVLAEIYAASLESKFSKELKATTSKVSLVDSVKFIIQALDDGIKYAQANFTDGATKKEFVMTVIRRVYKTVIGPSLPYYLYPFSSLIEKIVIDIVIDSALEYIVNKYKEGSWVKI